MANWLTPDEVHQIVKPPTKLWHKGEKRDGRLQKGQRPAEAVLITSERSKQFAAQRREKSRVAALEGQRLAAEKAYERIRKGQKPGHITDYDAWSLANEKLADEFYKSTSAKSMSDVFGSMGRASGFFSDEKEGPSNADGSDVAIEAAKTFIQVNQYFSEHKEELDNGDVIDVNPG